MDTIHEDKELSPDKITCTQLCKHLIEQVEKTYPTHVNTQDVFVNHVKNVMSTSRNVDLEVNNISKSFACWGLSRVRVSTDQFSLRNFSLFLTKLQEASYYLKDSLKTDSTFTTDSTKQ